MIIQQFDQKLRKWNVLAIGRVVGKKTGELPVQKVIVNGITKLTFNISAGATVNKDGEFIFQRVKCSIYEERDLRNKAVMEFATALNYGDIVMVGGWTRITTLTAAETGEKYQVSELRVEWISKMQPTPEEQQRELPIHGVYQSEEEEFPF